MPNPAATRSELLVASGGALSALRKEQRNMANIVPRKNQTGITPRRNQPAPLARAFGDWDPFERMRELMQWDLFSDLPRRWFGEDVSPLYTPRFDVREEKDALVFKADLPGIKEEDVDVSITGNRLTVSGKREEEGEVVDESQSYYCRERSYGSFSRSFTLPEEVDADQVQASMKDGVLSLRIPKSPTAQPKKIQLKSGNGDDGGKAKSKS
jgi:HSP20 family protein